MREYTPTSRCDRLVRQYQCQQNQTLVTSLSSSAVVWSVPLMARWAAAVVLAASFTLGGAALAASFGLLELGRGQEDIFALFSGTLALGALTILLQAIQAVEPRQ
jgi:hypothetical protein